MSAGLEPRADADSSAARIVRAAARVLTDDPAAPVQDIARAAGVGRATVYRHFASRDDLTRAMVLQGFRDGLEALEACDLDAGPADEALGRAVEALADVAQRWGVVIREHHTCSGDPDLMALKRALERRLQDTIRRGQQRGELAPTPVGWIAHAFGGLLAASLKAVADGALQPADAGRCVRALLLDGVRGHR